MTTMRMTATTRVAARAVTIIQVPTGGVLVGTQVQGQPPFEVTRTTRRTVLRQRLLHNRFGNATSLPGLSLPMSLVIRQ